MSVPLRDDGWAEVGHQDCANEIKYLRQRVDAAERVIWAARDLTSPSRDGTEIGLAYADESYAAFLGTRPDPARRA